MKITRNKDESYSAYQNYFGRHLIGDGPTRDTALKNLTHLIGETQIGGVKMHTLELTLTELLAIRFALDAERERILRFREKTACEHRRASAENILTATDSALVKVIAAGGDL